MSHTSGLSHLADTRESVCRDERVAELSVDSASPVTVLTSPGATHLDTDGFLWLGLSVSSLFEIFHDIFNFHYKVT